MFFILYREGFKDWVLHSTRLTEQDTKTALSILKAQSPDRTWIAGEATLTATYGIRIEPYTYT